MIRKAKIFPVNNKDRKFGSSQDYHALVVGKKHYLLTAHEMSVAEVRAAQNPEDFPRQYRWGRLFSKQK